MKPFLYIAAMAVAGSSTPLAAQPPQTRVEQGLLSGVDQKGVSAYLGVPFAAPPVGRNRWRSPQRVSKWIGVRKAQAFSANCMQDDGPQARNMPPWTPEYMIQGNTSEDCLYLNVWTPARNRSARLPVLVWIHGGAFRSGGGDVPIYDGRNLASREIVVVTINYRLGVWGFFAHPALSAEQGASGNYGLRDQIAALQWVNRNIAAFGGDSQQVTIAGQSAGAAAVHHLLVSPLAKGLFRRAIAQSGSGMGLPLLPRQRAEAAGVRMAEAFGAKSAEDLRALAPTQLTQGERKVGQSFGPIADAVVIPADAAATITAGQFNDTPILTGLVADESSAFPGYRPKEADFFRRQVAQRYGAKADRFFSLYPADTFAESSPALARDRGLVSMLLWATQRRKVSRHPIYAYLFSHVEPGAQSALYGAFHSSEIPYVFGTLDKATERNFGPMDRLISNTLQSYWINYIRTGDPNGTGLAEWPVLDDRMQILELVAKPRARRALSHERFQLFNDYVSSGGRLGLF